MMDRRAFFAGAIVALSAPLTADAQTTAKLYRVGVLASSTEANFEPSACIRKSGGPSKARG